MTTAWPPKSYTIIASHAGLRDEYNFSRLAFTALESTSACYLIPFPQRQKSICFLQAEKKPVCRKEMFSGGIRIGLLPSGLKSAHFPGDSLPWLRSGREYSSLRARKMRTCLRLSGSGNKSENGLRPDFRIYKARPLAGATKKGRLNNSLSIKAEVKNFIRQARG